MLSHESNIHKQKNIYMQYYKRRYKQIRETLTYIWEEKKNIKNPLTTVY